MCGLTGMAWGAHSRRRTEREDLLDRFTRMLLFSEHRGPYATGMAWVKSDGTYRVEKAPLPARQFIQSACYADALNEVSDELTVLMGHTRWPTRGSVNNPHNNHPLLLPIYARRPLSPVIDTTVRPSRAVGHVALTHNGHIANATERFQALGLPRTAQVDSELLVRLAQRHADRDGLDVNAFLADLELLDGRINLVLVTTTRPEEILLLKGNMPLEVRIQAERQVLCYASEARMLDIALASDAGWQPLPLARGEGLIVNTKTWTQQRVPFVFQGLHTDAGSSYTGVTTRKERTR
ncbi:MAG: class II glutamine amidotransferase [Armatimonadota bacterium]